MEDILSSIKRIIAEDSEANLSAPRTKRAVGLSAMPVTAPHRDDDDSEVLELTDALPEPVMPTTAAKPVATGATPSAAPAAAPAPSPPAVATAVQPEFVSPTTVDASRASLAALSALIVKPEVAGADTLEGLVRDMLKPMIGAWLDANLPAVVDRLVAQEIARITTRG